MSRSPRSSLATSRSRQRGWKPHRPATGTATIARQEKSVLSSWRAPSLNACGYKTILVLFTRSSHGWNHTVDRIYGGIDSPIQSLVILLFVSSYLSATHLRTEGT